MKILLLDCYPKKSYRISKDNNGAFGASADFGDGWFAALLKRLVAGSLDWPPVYAMQVLGSLRAAGHDVRYARDLDGTVDADLCLSTTSIVCHETELDAITKLRAQGIPVGAIGPFGTAVADPYVAAGAFVISGEPEMFFHHFNKSVDEIRALGPICRPEHTVELDELPYPAWDILPRGWTPKMRFLAGNRPVIPMLASRGCPYACFHYCTYPLQQGRRLRKRSPDAVVAEMAHWQDTLGASSFLFRDPVFSLDRGHTLALCDEIQRSGRTFRFAVETHLKDLDEELVDRLYAAGLRLIYVGIESITPEVIADAKRIAIAPDEQERRIRMLERRGIRVKTMYIIGFPKDNEANFRENLAYALRLGTAFAMFNVFTPYPGTPAYERFKDKLLSRRFEDFTQAHLVFEHESYTPADIRRLVTMAYRRYYTHPRWLLKYLKMSWSADKK